MSVTFKQRTLIAPLDWGLGHATRCVPLIERCLAEGHEVLLASNGRSAEWLRQRFPQLEVLTDIPDYAVTYPSNGFMSIHFTKHMLRLLRVVRKEHRWLQHIIEARKIDRVYSDNRYGLYHDRVPCTLITHQLYVQVPWWSKAFIYPLLSSYFKRFNSIWVPDSKEGNTLSGSLAHGGTWDTRVNYIGTQSRFPTKPTEKHELQSEVPNHEIVAIISGPEPTRTAFEQILRRLLLESSYRSLLILGKPGEFSREHSGQLTIINHLSDAELADALQRASLVVCRSGYSTLMDLEKLGVKALLVPTPGQTEQEYLAEYHSQQGNHFRIEQKHLSTENLQRLIQLKVES